MFILLLFSLEWSTYLQTLSTTVTINTVTDYQSPGKAGETLPNSVNPMPRTHMVGVNLWPPPHVPHGVYVCRRWWVHTHTHTRIITTSELQNESLSKSFKTKKKTTQKVILETVSWGYRSVVQKVCNMQKVPSAIWSTVGSQQSNQPKKTSNSASALQLQKKVGSLSKALFFLFFLRNALITRQINIH